MSGHFLFQLKSKLDAKIQCSLSVVYLTYKLSIPTGHVDIKLTTEKSMFKKKREKQTSDDLLEFHENI